MSNIALVLVSKVAKKDDGRRKYDKYHRIMDQLKSQHKTEKEVLVAIAKPAITKERKFALQLIKNQGNLCTM